MLILAAYLTNSQEIRDAADVKIREFSFFKVIFGLFFLFSLLVEVEMIYAVLCKS